MKLVMLIVSLALSSTVEHTENRGPVAATIRLEPEKPLIGDPVTLTISVVAEPDVELLMPEFGEALDRFTILDFVPRQEIDDEGRTLATQTYRLQPAMSGKQSIPPILIEFVDHRDGKPSAPEGEDAFELLTSRLDFVIESVLPENASNELRPPLGKLEPLAMSPARKATWALAIVLTIFLILTPWLIRWVQNRQRIARRKSAYEIARSRLDRLTSRPIPQSEAIDGFFVELSSIVRRYLEDRFELRAPELTTEEFLDTVTKSTVLSSDHQSLLSDFLRQADLVKFAGVKPGSNEIDAAVSAANRFLEETRENAPLVEEPAHV